MDSHIVSLVLLMTPGLAFFYGGMVREKNVLNTMLMATCTAGIVAMQWALFGYTFAYGHYNPEREADGTRCEDTRSCDHGRPIGGPSYLFLGSVGGPASDIAPAVPQSSFMTFQLTFAAITPAIISGAVVERMPFKVYVLFVLFWTTCVYDPICHWIWGGGWMSCRFCWRDRGSRLGRRFCLRMRSHDWQTARHVDMRTDPHNVIRPA